MISATLFAAALAAAPAGAVPSFECPDADINRTYEFRWRAFGRHCVKTPEGWVVTEFLPDVPWAGKYNTIVCPAGHHLREARWMHDTSVASDYARFWFGTNGAHRVKYCTWIGSSLIDVVRVTGDASTAVELLDPIVALYESWETKPIVYRTCPEGEPFPMGGDGKGMFTSVDDREGSEYSLGRDGYRPLFNSAMYGEAKAIAEIARLAKRADIAARFSRKAEALGRGIREKLWDPELSFFTTVRTNGTRSTVRELHGYAPWYFGMPLAGFGDAWAQVESEEGFAAPFGLCFAERRAPGFRIAYDGHPCQWNGPSWPFATSIVLTGLANAIAEGSSGDVGRETYVKLLHQYAAQQVRRTEDGKAIPWIDENLDPFTGVWLSRAILHAQGKKDERGEDYNHSTFADLVISGLCGLRPQLDGALEIRPLIPDTWDFTCLENVHVRGRSISLYWDRTGRRYGKGAGFSVWADGREVHRAGAPAPCRLFDPRPLTAGWENKDPDRKEFPTEGVIWRAAGCADAAFSVIRAGGAEGSVEVKNGVVRIVKTNEKGYLIVEGPEFATAEPDQSVRLLADVAVTGSNGDYCHGFLRAHGRKPGYGISELFEKDYAGGGIPESLGLPNSPRGQTYRKYASEVAHDGVLTPAIVVAGNPSVSVWSNWSVSSLKAEKQAWGRKYSTWGVPRERDRMDEAAYDRGLAADVQHTAKVVKGKCGPELRVDGRAVQPVIYKGRHCSVEQIPPPELFAGHTVTNAHIPLMVKDIRLGRVPGCRGYWTKDGFDAKGAVREIKDSMRLVPDVPFVLAIGCNAYPEFAESEHPDEAWRHKDGKVVLGNSGSCVASYVIPTAGAKLWPWPSYSSRAWRDGVKRCLKSLVAELKAQGLDKRIVGIHTFGYQDGQFSVCYPDYSAPAKAEYADFCREGGHASTNYEFFCKQTGLRAQEEFAREFRHLMGKDVVSIMWCQSPHRANAATSWNIGEFLRSDAMDILVAQPNYERRRPGITGANRLPAASFRLHGKFFFEELDFRTYAMVEPWSGPSSAIGLGQASDFGMWQSIFRKDAGVMVAQGMGWWFYDMANGWFSAPEIVDDIATALKADAAGRRAGLTDWKPGVALVVDEAGLLGWADGMKFLPRPADFSYADQLFLLARSGVPFDSYLLEDVLVNPALLEPYRMVAFNLMRRVDAPRADLIRRLSSAKRTFLYLPRCGELGGLAEATGMTLVCGEKADHTVVAEPGFACEANGLQYHDMLRNAASLEFPPPQLADWPRNSVAEGPGVKVHARYAKDGKPATAERRDGLVRHIVFTEAGGVSPAAFNKFAREAGAYVPLAADIAQVDMNGAFVNLHALEDAVCDFRLPYPCRVVNLKTGREEKTRDGILPLKMSAGETCQFALK